MTKLNTNWQQDIIPDFDVMKWKQETQAKILQETEGMTREEIRKYFRQASERAAIRRKELAERRAAENPK
jgi:hypothetical protein